jgi:RNA 2',3'-cyclic 3'-phosphodiesterase
MRAFLGISIPDELKTKIISIQKRFSGFDIKLVEPQNLHFNMKFFSEISDEDVKRLKANLEEVCKRFKPFEIKINGLGAFPNNEYVRIVWIGVKEGHDEMVLLADEIQNSIQSLGFEHDERFEPHLTLGRVRSGKNKEKLSKVMKELENCEIGTMKVDKIRLFQSTLGSDGPVYNAVFEIGL